jgi:hypothetical protein
VLAPTTAASTGGRCGSTAGNAADVWTAGALIVAGMTGAG